MLSRPGRPLQGFSWGASTLRLTKKKKKKQCSDLTKDLDRQSEIALLLRRAESIRLWGASWWLMLHLDAATGLAARSHSSGHKHFMACQVSAEAASLFLARRRFLGFHKSLSSLFRKHAWKYDDYVVLGREGWKLELNVNDPNMFIQRREMESHSHRK